jgi:hypothetical protein
MALRFLADHCVSNYTVQTLREAQYEVFRLRDVLPVESSDAFVLAKAQEIDAVLISLDGTSPISSTTRPQRTESSGERDQASVSRTTRTSPTLPPGECAMQRTDSVAYCGTTRPEQHEYWLGLFF